MKGGWKLHVAVWDTAYSFDQLFTYTSVEPVACGCRVVVPFGRSNAKRVGMVFSSEPAQWSEQERLKPISFVMDASPVLDDEQLDLITWLKDTTFCTYSEAIRTVLPAGMQVQIYQKAALASPLPEAALTASEEQLLAFLKAAKSERTFDRLLESEGNAEKQQTLDALFQKGFLVMTDCARQKVGTAGIRMLRLAAGQEQRRKQVRVTPKQQKLLTLLEEQPDLSEKEACYLCGITSAVVQKVVKDGLVERYFGETYRDVVLSEQPLDPEQVVLSEAQQAVFTPVWEAVRTGQPQCFLLHGVTGSGKTSVFQRLIHETIRIGKQVILLVPEIALTPQIVEGFRRLFGEQVTVLHSELSLGQRSDAYRRIQSGAAKIVIGTRSAIFAPAQQLGLVIVDEEGERAYKSDSAPRYHAIDVAKKRCRTHQATLLLASATPSVESYSYAKKGVYTLLELKQRYGNMPLPEVTVVNMQEERQLGNDSEFSDALMHALRENLAAGEQSILLLNRRGYHTIVRCCNCNEPVYCPNCSVPMTYHKANESLMCHYCGHTQSMVTKCSHCGDTTFRKMGFGTQTLEEALAAAVPDARILRMDADTTLSRHAYEEKFNAFAAGDYDIMVGTQMIGKGLNFPKVTLVGVLSVDKALFSGDFRSYERTFSLITQVVGRGGRGSRPGRAILQTFLPEHYVLQLAASQDYAGFYQEEMALRRALIFPPICDICVLGVVGVKEEQVQAAAVFLAQSLRDLVQQTQFTLPLWILGPMPFTYGKIGGKYRYRIILKCKNTKPYRELIRQALAAVYAQRAYAKLHLYADMNGDIGV